MDENIIIDHFRHPKNFGTLPQKTHHAASENFSCGDRISIDAVVRDNTLESIRWTGDGCALSLGSMSLLSEHIENTRIETVLGFSKEKILNLLEMPTLSPTRLRCALLGLETVQRALRNPQKNAEEEGSPLPT